MNVSAAVEIGVRRVDDEVVGGVAGRAVVVDGDRAAGAVGRAGDRGRALERVVGQHEDVDAVSSLVVAVSSAMSASALMLIEAVTAVLLSVPSNAV